MVRCYEKGTFAVDSGKRKIYFFADQHLRTVAATSAPASTPTPAKTSQQQQQQQQQRHKQSAVPGLALPNAPVSGSDLTRMLIAISLLHKTNRITSTQRSTLKDQALLNNGVLFGVLEAFMADQAKDLDELADTLSRLCALV